MFRHSVEGEQKWHSRVQNDEGPQGFLDHCHTLQQRAVVREQPVGGNKAHVPSSAAASCSRENPEAILDGKPDTTCHDDCHNACSDQVLTDLASVFGKFLAIIIAVFINPVIYHHCNDI